jgi:hypothetical protein
MKTLIEKLKKPTNKRTKFGSNVAKVGAGISIAGVGIGGGVEFFEPNILELLPPTWIAVLLLTDKIIIALGLIISAIGVKVVNDVKE